ncbi:galactose-3-O-sulfotransferase 2-like isoform X2 [Engystomops pustulosus]
MKLVYAVIFFVVLSISLHLFDTREQPKFPFPANRCDERNNTDTGLSRLKSVISDEMPESDWKQLLEIVEKWKVQKEDLQQKPSTEESFNQSPYVKRESCPPRENIFFLKAHKTASSTIMNILLRYGEYHNLTFAFPKVKHQFWYPGYFSAKHVQGYSSEKKPKFNIMCHHMRFSLIEVEKVMPKDTFYFTILRNPVSLMESSFAYYKYSSSFYNVTSLEDFIQNTSKFYRSKEYDSAFAKNLLTHDLGFHHNAPDSPKQYKLLTNAVDTIFDLVLITEYFDESLVLLKDALCWTFDDVLSFPLNIRSNTSRKILSEETKERIKSWNQLDWQLYVHFNNSFWNRVEKFGRERMEKEVRELRKRREQLSEKCLDAQVEPNKLKDKAMVPYQPYLIRILGYNLKPGLSINDQILCHRLVLPEIPYTQLLWDKQIGNKTKT